MVRDEAKLLDELKSIIPKTAYGANGTMYAIALEGWRRGLTLKFYTKFVKDTAKIRYALSDDEKEVKFQLSLAEHIPKEARNITRSKKTTKEYLIRNDVPTPRGGSFGKEHTNEDIIEFAKTLEYPIVLKPANASLGIGVKTNITNMDTFKEHLEYLRGKRGDDEVIVEQQVSGEDTRLFVVGEQVVSAFKRITANVTGDGVHSIEELIEKKNKERKKNPHVGGSKISITDEVHEYLRNNGLRLDSVPSEGKRVYLHKSSIASNGADTVEVTDRLTAESKKVAVDAVKTLPGLSVCGVDVMIDYEEGTNYVLELNSRPNIGGSLFPVEGTPTNISKAIVDYYFPDLPELAPNSPSSQLHFDYEEIEEVLKSGVVKEVTVPSVPRKNLVIKKLVISGKVQGVGFRNWVYKKATNRRISGYVKNLKNKKVQIIAAGKEDKMEDFIRLIENKTPKKMRVKEVKNNNWDKPVMTGFRVKKKPANVKTLRESLRKEEDKNQELMQRLQSVEKELHNLKKSKSWKVTSPIRKAVKKIKG
ncbi:acylphosphatase [Virgibacillus xinjiangensis]|uniref:acylphosphatase n=1 Tax=Virgibacillus xinjiangensis TaxID=393090 RepID=A0ABV7CU11_9BACI